MTIEYLVPFVFAMFPIAERYAISVALAKYNMSIPVAFAIVLVGNMLPVIAIVYLLGPITDFISKYWDWFRRLFETVCKWSRGKNAKRFEALEDLAILLIAALPIPLMGTWSAALAAFLFDVPPKKSIPLIFIGAIISNTIVALGVEGILLLF